jgi:hypothetical protein
VIEYRHCERSEAIHGRGTAARWIASSRSLSSGAHSRDPLAPRNDGEHSAGVLTMSVGWVERFAKPITVVENMIGIAPLNPSYASTDLPDGQINDGLCFCLV